MKTKVFLDHIDNKIDEKLAAAMNWTGMTAELRAKKVFIKPNLTYPKFKPGVTTTPQLLETLIRRLTDLGCDVIVGESDGGYNSYEVKDAFHDFGLYEFQKKYGIRVVNLSKEPFHYLTVY